MARKEPAPFNNPFTDPRVRGRLRQAVVPAEKPPAPRLPPRRRPDAPLTAEEEARLWDAATEGGTPLHRPVAGMAGGAPPRFVHGNLVHPDEEAFARLVEFVRGEGDFALWDQDEFVEGAPGTGDSRMLERLRRGEFSVQGYVDLHGMIVDEAKTELDAFFTRARRLGWRCVLVVHGRGLHSKDRVPVLKERVVTWLGHGRFSRQVLAFCTARRHDGGAGALYVLLRTAPELRRTRGRRRAV